MINIRTTLPIKLHQGETAFSHTIRVARFLGMASVEAAGLRMFSGKELLFRKGFLIPYGRTRFVAAMAHEEERSYLNRSTDLPLLWNLAGRPLETAAPSLDSDLIYTHIFNASIPVYRVGTCFECQAEQIQNRGYTWWLRDHSISGIEICSKHRSTLLKADFNGILNGLGKLPSEIKWTLQDQFPSQHYARQFADEVRKVESNSLRYNPNEIAASLEEKITGRTRFIYKDHERSTDYALNFFDHGQVQLIMGDMEAFRTELMAAFLYLKVSWKTTIHLLMIHDLISTTSFTPFGDQIGSV